MANVIDFSVFQGNENFWKPEEGKNYLIRVANWRIDFKQFKDEKGVLGEPKPVLAMDVVGIGKELLAKPKEFSSGSRSFIFGMKPYLEEAASNNQNTVSVFLRKLNGKEYVITDPRELERVA